MANKKPKSLPTTLVPCDGCTLCCCGDAIRILSEDNGKNYLTEPHPFIPGALMIAHKYDGSCIYLGENGCTIQGYAPSLCRTADCRALALKLNFEEAMKLHNLRRLDIRVWDKGWNLLQEKKMNAQRISSDLSKSGSLK